MFAETSGTEMTEEKDWLKMIIKRSERMERINKWRNRKKDDSRFISSSQSHAIMWEKMDPDKL